ncbi:Peptidylprolyl isomerase [Tribonema minus]|uniref:peptidylprolyl isomerase n=1 Tax=Tribonema minus TaxID=303371 RepID=A0A835ZFS8_9STRA|nr:Peptidylprolyl isomerase [Tribonema minus]
MLVTKLLAAAALALPVCHAFGNGARVTMAVQKGTDAVSRRSLMDKAAVAAVAAAGMFNVAPAQAEDAPAAVDVHADFITTETGLRYKVIKEGTGAQPPPSSNVKAHYTGWLGGFGDEDASVKFDSSRDRGRPFTFKAGVGQVIKAWDESVLAMKVGERRLIIVPPDLGYGKRGAGGVIPANATLYFDVELLGIL